MSKGKQIKTEVTLEQLLAKNNVVHIKDFSEIEKLIDFHNLDKDKTPTIVTKRKTILIFDNSTFNETYLIDVFNEFMETQPPYITKEDVDIMYIDDLFLRMQIFVPSVTKDSFDFENSVVIKELEMSAVKPGFIIINPERNQITSFPEPDFISINIENMNKIMSWLK
ncbi:hypothetical protein M0Q97_02270 [Candidatus Dojkabacteria bacterium]|jgi:hypothetical protein|nr:hypothetical protein [Candidatus Dojkabacteria bacterium]